MRRRAAGLLHALRADSPWATRGVSPPRLGPSTHSRRPLACLGKASFLWPGGCWAGLKWEHKRILLVTCRERVSLVSGGNLAFWALLCPASFLMTKPETQGEQDCVTSAYFIPDQTPAAAALHGGRLPTPEVQGRRRTRPSAHFSQDTEPSPRCFSLAGLENTQGRLEEKLPSVGPCGRPTWKVHTGGPRGRPTIASTFVDAFEHLSNSIPSSCIYDKYSNRGCKGSLMSPFLCNITHSLHRHVTICHQTNDGPRELGSLVGPRCSLTLGSPGPGRRCTQQSWDGSRFLPL